jgi:multidrug transporter EmrE-like cation transporter
MFRSDMRAYLTNLPGRNLAVTAVLIFGNLLFNIIANAGFKNSASSPNWNGFLIWQIVGNIAGFITVLTLTGLFRLIPVSVAYTVTTGLAVVGVQVIVARILFQEAISSGQWLGTAFVVIGIALICRQ